MEPYTYPRTNIYPNAFKQPPETYPTFELQAATFKRESAKNPHGVYDGASNLANLVFRHVSDLELYINGTRTARQFLDERRLGISVIFGGPKIDNPIAADLQVTRDNLYLRVGEADSPLTTIWRPNSRAKNPFTYAIASLSEEDRFLFANPGQEMPTPITKRQTFTKPVTQDEYQKSPELRAARRFWDIERKLMGSLATDDLRTRERQIVPVIW